MLNKDGIRELAYVVRISEVRDIEGVNNQVAIVNGWQVFVKRDEFKAGDLAVYFEIDSKVPELECFEFLRKYHFKVKTQRFVKGKVLSQGLVIKPEDLDLENVQEGDFLTKQLGVTYYEPEDNTRKASNEELIKMKVEKRMARWTKKHSFLSKFGFIVKIVTWFTEKKIRSKQTKSKRDWPSWVVKTDEERAQNCFEAMKRLPYDYWIATEKVDGTSTTFTMKQAPAKKRELIVCSRNVVYNAPEKEDRNYYKDSDGNVYLEMAAKYDMKGVLSKYLDGNVDLEWVTIQGETYGGTIQKRSYGNEHRLAIFNVIYKEKGLPPVRLNPYEMAEMLLELQTPNGMTLKTVPILGDVFLPETCDDLLAGAGGASQIDGEMREGIVLRSPDGLHSFKAVDNNFLLKYHN
jgi:hypothetical protein